MATVTFEGTNAGGQARSPGAAAWACAQLGFRVFPLVPGVGLPAFTGWPDTATADEDVIFDWWGGQYATHGVGIATGEGSGVWVLDIDRKRGVNGFATLQRLTEQHCDDAAWLGRTLTVATPSGGVHVYFRWAEGLVCSTGDSNRLGPGLDVRGTRGYVRAPGWRGYQVVPRNGVRSVAVRSAPEWLAELSRKRPPRAGATGREAYAGAWEGFDQRLTLAKLGNTPVGGRNGALNLAAFKFGISGDVAADEAWALCAAQLISMGAGDDMPAWKRTFDSGWNAGLAAREPA